jgi:hypothetical protein
MYVGEAYLGFGDMYGVEDGPSILARTKTRDIDDAPGDIEDPVNSTIIDSNDNGIGKGILILVLVMIVFAWKHE